MGRAAGWNNGPTLPAIGGNAIAILPASPFAGLEQTGVVNDDDVGYRSRGAI